MKKPCEREDSQFDYIFSDYIYIIIILYAVYYTYIYTC